jgi:hypothetical protein
MASIKNIKKDIDFLVDEVISDSFLCLSLNPGKKNEEIIAVINEIAEKRNDLIARTNDVPKSGKRSEIKAHFKAIYDDLFEKIDSSFDKLSKVVEAK